MHFFFALFFPNSIFTATYSDYFLY